VSQVLYIGKIKVSHKKVPDSFIDDALEKFRVHELEKGKSKIAKEGSNHNISALGASAGSNGHLNQAQTPGNSIVIGLCRDEELCHRGSQVNLLQQILQEIYILFPTALFNHWCIRVHIIIVIKTYCKQITNLPKSFILLMNMLIDISLFLCFMILFHLFLEMFWLFWTGCNAIF
jgi:hypothetical protein